MNTSVYVLTWRQIIDFKYNTNNSNLFTLPTYNALHFGKDVMWAAQAIKVGYSWHIGNGRKVRFWEDNWIGVACLAIIFWDLYVLVNEKTRSVADMWDGSTLKCTFKRCLTDSGYL